MSKSTGSVKKGKSKIKGGAIGGIVVGAIVVIVLLILIALIIRHRKKKAGRKVIATDGAPSQVQQV